MFFPRVQSNVFSIHLRARNDLYPLSVQLQNIENTLNIIILKGLSTYCYVSFKPFLKTIIEASSFYASLDIIKSRSYNLILKREFSTFCGLSDCFFYIKGRLYDILWIVWLFFILKGDFTIFCGLSDCFFILKGEFTIFCGLSDCLALLENFHYSESDISYIRTVLPPTVEEEFFIFLKQLNPSEVQVYALPEGKNSFPDYI